LFEYLTIIGLLFQSQRYVDEVRTIGYRKRSWVSSMHSVRLPCCPSYDSTDGIIRGSLYNSGYVFTETDIPEVLDAVCIFQIDLKGYVPSALGQAALKEWATSIASIEEFFYKQKLRSSRLLRDIELPPLDSVRTCTLCTRHFSPLTLRAKVHCRICGEVVFLNHAKLRKVVIMSY